MVMDMPIPFDSMYGRAASMSDSTSAWQESMPKNMTKAFTVATIMLMPMIR